MNERENINIPKEINPMVKIIENTPKVTDADVKKSLEILLKSLPLHRRELVQNAIDRIDNKPIKKKGFFKEFIQDFADGLGDFK